MASLSSPAADWSRDVETLQAGTAAGQYVSNWEGECLPAVYFSQSLIADAIASFPRDVYRHKSDGGREAIKSPKWVDSPNDYERGFSFWYRVIISLLADGNAFIRIVRENDATTGLVRHLHVIHPHMVEVKHVDGRVQFEIGDSGNGSPMEIVGRERMIHIPAFVKPGDLRGISPIDAARETIGLALAAEEFGARFFSQGTTMSGVIEHPGNPKPTEVALLRKMFRKTHAGVKNSHAVGILSGGATWTNIAVTPEQAQFLETRKYHDVQVGKLYRIPAYLLDPTVSSSWGSGVEEQNKFFVSWTLMPWLVRVEEAVSQELLPKGQVFKFNTRAMMRATDADRATYYQSGLMNGWLSPDDIRALEEYDSLPADGDKYYRPSNLIELGSNQTAPTGA